MLVDQWSEDILLTILTPTIVVELLLLHDSVVHHKVQEVQYWSGSWFDLDQNQNTFEEISFFGSDLNYIHEHKSKVSFSGSWNCSHFFARWHVGQCLHELFILAERFLNAEKHIFLGHADLWQPCSTHFNQRSNQIFVPKSQFVFLLFIWIKILEHFPLFSCTIANARTWVNNVVNGHYSKTLVRQRDTVKSTGLKMCVCVLTCEPVHTLDWMDFIRSDEGCRWWKTLDTISPEENVQIW